jgi:hypothetical protein
MLGLLASVVAAGGVVVVACWADAGADTIAAVVKVIAAAAVAARSLRWMGVLISNFLSALRVLLQAYLRGVVALDSAG